MKEPLVKVFHNADQHLAAMVLGIGVTEYARAYIAVVVNSNFSRYASILPPDAGVDEVLATYLSVGTLLRAVSKRIHKRFLNLRESGVGRFSRIARESYRRASGSR